MKIRRVDFYPVDWLEGVEELSIEEVGVYIQVCAKIYARGGPISFLAVKAACRCHGNQLNRILLRLETLGKIDRKGEEIDSKRCRNELERAYNRLGKARENGSKGGRPKDLAKPDGFTDEKAIIQQPTTNNQQEESTYVDSPPVSPIKGASNVSRRTKHRLPPDWEPDEQNREYARNYGFDPDWLLVEFRDYWTDPDTRNALHSDWARVWQRRCRDLYARKGGNGTARPRQNDGRNQGVVAIVGKLIAEEEGWGLPH